MYHVEMVTHYEDGDMYDLLCDVLGASWSDCLWEAGLRCRDFATLEEAETHAQKCHEVSGREFLAVEGVCPNNN